MSFEIVNTNIMDTMNKINGIGNPAYVYLVPDSYDNIQDAIDTAWSNGHDENDPAIIKILPDATPYNENLLLYSGIYLESQMEKDKPVINGIVLFGQTTGTFILRNLAFTSSSGTIIDDSDGELTDCNFIMDNITMLGSAGGDFYAIDMRGSSGSVTVRDCSITGTTGSAINFENGIDAIISDSTITGNEVSIKNGNGSIVTVRNSSIVGRMTVDESTLQIDRCRCEIVNSSTVESWINVINDGTVSVNGATLTILDSTITSFFRNVNSLGNPTNTGLLYITGLLLSGESNNYSTFRFSPSSAQFSGNTYWSNGHIYTITTTPTNSNASTAGVPVNGLYRTTSTSPDPSPIYMRTE